MSTLFVIINALIILYSHLQQAGADYNCPVNKPDRDCDMLCDSNTLICYQPGWTATCSNNYDCILNCIGGGVCNQGAIINCPINGKCFINCNGDHACLGININCAPNDECHVLCDGTRGCMDANIMWPTNTAVNYTLTCDPTNDQDTANNPCLNVTTFAPTAATTSDPTAIPTVDSTTSRTNNPTASPTNNPTPSPTNNPTPSPTDNPTPSPTDNPAPSPSNYPTPSPTDYPTASPTDYPTPSPTAYPTASSTNQPTPSPTNVPSKSGQTAGNTPTTYIEVTVASTSQGEAGVDEKTTIKPSVSPTLGSKQAPNADTISFRNHYVVLALFIIISILCIAILSLIAILCLKRGKNKKSNKKQIHSNGVGLTKMQKPQNIVVSDSSINAIINETMNGMQIVSPLTDDLSNNNDIYEDVEDMFTMDTTETIGGPSKTVDGDNMQIVVSTPTIPSDINGEKLSVVDIDDDMYDKPDSVHDQGLLINHTKKTPGMEAITTLSPKSFNIVTKRFIDDGDGHNELNGVVHDDYMEDMDTIQ